MRKFQCLLILCLSIQLAFAQEHPETIYCVEIYQTTDISLVKPETILEMPEYAVVEYIDGLYVIYLPYKSKNNAINHSLKYKQNYEDVKIVEKTQEEVNKMYPLYSID